MNRDREIKKILIANRGVTAVRIMHTCRDRKIPTTAVYSTPDRLAHHVFMADSAVHIGEAPPAESYLNMGKMIAAAIQSRSDAIHPGWGFLAEDPERVAVIFATGIGGINGLLTQHKVLLEKGPGRVSPFTVPALMANAAGGHIAVRHGFTGPNFCTVSACASGAHAVGEGMRIVRDGLADVTIVGGSESATLPLTVAAFAQMTALTKNPDPELASRPFDAERDGFVMSEGACALVLEEEERAWSPGERGSTRRWPATGPRTTPSTSPRPTRRGRERPSRSAAASRTRERSRVRSATSTPTAPPPR